LAISREKNKQHTSRINTNGAQAGFRKWQSAEFKGGNQPNQNCNKNSIVAVTPEINTNFGTSCHKQTKFWRILPHKFK
jgi:hypothetical protein